MRQLLLTLITLALVSARCFYSLAEVESNPLFSPAVATSYNLTSILNTMNACCVDRAQVAGWNNFRGIYVVYSNGTVVPGEPMNLPDTSVFFKKSALCGTGIVFARRDCRPCNNVIYPIGDPQCPDRMFSHEPQCNDVCPIYDGYCTDLQPTFPAEPCPPALGTYWNPQCDVEYDEPHSEDQQHMPYHCDPQPCSQPTVSPDSQHEQPANYCINHITYSPILYNQEIQRPTTDNPSPPVNIPLEVCPIEPESRPRPRQICRTSKRVKCGPGYRTRRIRTKSRSFAYATVNNKNILTVNEINNKDSKTRIILDGCTRVKIRILNHPDTLRAIKETAEQKLGAPADLYVSDTSGVYVLANNAMYTMKGPGSAPKPLTEKQAKKLMERGLYSVDIRS